MPTRWLLLLFALVSCGLAQNGPCTESAIRNAVQSQKIVRSDDHYLYSARFNKPIANSNQVPSSSSVTNQTISEQPERIVTSTSGDMAYEYGSAHIVRNLISGQRVETNAFYLRVWKAVGNTCEEAAIQGAPENLRDLLQSAPATENNSKKEPK